MTRRRILMASVGLLAIACCLPTLTFLGSKGDNPTWPGIAVLALGWLAVYYAQFGWFANFFWALGGVLLLRKKDRGARICSTLAVLAAANCITLRSLRIPEDESGSPARASLQTLGPGFYFWIASMVVLLVATYWKKESDAKA